MECLGLIPRRAHPHVAFAATSQKGWEFSCRRSEGIGVVRDASLITAITPLHHMGPAQRGLAIEPTQKVRYVAQITGIVASSQYGEARAEISAAGLFQFALDHLGRTRRHDIIFTGWC
jgi:hypothetical protein